MSNRSPSPPSSLASETLEAVRQSLRRWGRRVARGIGIVSGIVLIVIGPLILGLQTDAGATTAAQWLASVANPLPNTQLRVESASGTWLSSLRLTNVTLTRRDTAAADRPPLARVDTIDVRYRLLPILQGRAHLTTLTVRGPEVHMQQSADSTWDWAHILPAADEPEPDTASGFSLRIDALRLTDGGFTAAYYTPVGDSTAHVRQVKVEARDVSYASPITGRLDTLGLQGRLPGDATDLQLGARGAVDETSLRLDTLFLDSPRSQVRGGGHVRLPRGPRETMDEMGLVLRARPFALRDLALFAPWIDVDPQETVDLDLGITGSGQRLSVTTDARFSGGGVVAADAELTPATEATTEGPPLYYRVNAQIKDLTTSLLGPPSPAQNRINATLTADLEGRSVRALDGTIDLQLTDTHWSALQTRNVSLQSTVRQGAASVQLSGTLNDAPMEISGDMSPFETEPSVNLTGRVQNLRLRSLDPDLAVEGRLTARTELRGRALGTSDERITVDVGLTSSRIGVQSIEAGDLSLTVRPEETNIDGTLNLPGGRLTARAVAALDGTERFRLDKLTLENVNLPAFAGDTTSSRVSGSAQVRGRGFQAPTAAVETSFQFADGHYGPHTFSDISAEAKLEDGRLTAEINGTLNDGAWSLAGTGRPFAAAPQFELSRGQFRRFDVGPFVGSATQTSQLNGTVRGQLDGTTPSEMSADLEVRLDSSRIGRQPLPSGSLRIRLHNATLDARARVRTPDGGAQFTAGGRPFDEVPTYKITEGTYRSIDIGALLDDPSLVTALSGSFQLSGRGASAAALTLDGRLSVDDSRINGAAVSSGQISLGADDGTARLDGTVSLAGGRANLRSRVDSLASTPTYQLQMSVDSVDAAALAGLDSLQAHIGRLRWSLEGRGSDVSSLRGSTRLSATQLKINRLRIDTTTFAANIQQGRLAVDTFRVRGNALESRGSGLLALTDTTATSDFSLVTTLTNARPIRSILRGRAFQLERAEIVTHVYGSSLASQRFDGRATVKSLKYNDLQLTEAELSFNGHRGKQHFFQHLEVEGTLGYFSVPSMSVEETDVSAVYDGQTVNLVSQVRIDPTHKGRVHATITPTDSVTKATVTTLNLQMGRDEWSLLQDATIIASDHYRVRGLLLYSGDQQIAADGIVDFEGRQSLVVTIEGVRLGAVSPLFGLSGLDGRLSGSVDLTGSAADPVLDTRLALDLESQDRPVGTLRLNATYEALQIDLDAELTHTDGSALRAEGTLPTDLRLNAEAPVSVAREPVRLDIQTNRFPVNWIDPFLDPTSVRNVKGILTADVKVRGTRDTPELSGIASLDGGAASFPSLETRYRNAGGTLRFANDQVTLEEVVVHSTNDGRLRAEGTINFPALTVGEYDLKLRASDFIAIDTRAYQRAIVDGNMTMRGTTRKPVLSGTVQLQSADIYFNEALATSGASVRTVPLDERDQLTLENRFGIRLSEADTTAFDLYEALAMDLTVQIQRNTWLRSRSTPEMNIQFTGDLDLNKNHDEDPKVFGSIQVVTERSTLRQFGQQFQITEGTLTFNGDPYTPYLNLEAVYEQRAREAQGTEVTITLRLEGRPDELSPTLSSDPPMDTRNILSYLATGRPANEIRSGSGNLATQVALGQASTFVENLAASELGLDVVRVQLRTSGTSYLTVGRYFTPRLFVSIEQPVTTSPLGSTQSPQYLPDLTLEYQLLDTLMLRALNNQQSLQLNLLFEYAY